MKITIKDVAEKAGVSISTVSKVLNGSSRISGGKGTLPAGQKKISLSEREKG
ncbi:MAG: LacI family DNA-binding transcriptional regulator [Spirochaetales bacterium]|nr:LacI family DNA-binding transcriptional regulator [Spirochaetales bacterium]